MKYVRDIRDSRASSSRLPKSKFKFSFKKIFNRRVQDWAIKIFALLIALAAFMFLWYAKDLPDPNKLLSRQVPQSTKIYARDGSLLYEVHGEVKRTLIPFSEMNDNIKHATIAIEDKDFYKEGGINLKGILRSILVDIIHLGKAQGGSTITQQFVRNAVLTQEKSWSRKIKEIVLSLEINERFSKDDILKLYLNEIPYGRNAYGIQAAAQAYFGIDAKNVDLAQAAYLAALPQSPSYYSPLGPHRDGLDSRKNTVLDQMLVQGYINQQQHDQAKIEPVKFLQSGDRIVAPHFVFYVEDYITSKYGENALETGGLQIYTTLDPHLQQIAEQDIADTVTKNGPKDHFNNAALVAEDAKTGQILAMVGSKDYFGASEPAGCKPGLNCKFEPNVNVAVSQRQAGSSMKPYVYATAFKPEFHMAPATPRMDVVTDFGTYGGKDYAPQNYNKHSYGPLTIRESLAGSLNVPAVKTLFQVGVDNAVQTMHDFGITSPLKDCGLSLVLGGCEVTLVDHVSGYTTLANEGLHHQQTGILKILDSSGNVLEQYQDSTKQVIDPQSAYEVINIMTDNQDRIFTFGSSANTLTLPDRPVAAKTGTTQNFKDGWTLGFTPSLVTGVWTGNNDGSLMTQDAVVTAGPIWQRFMKEATAGTPVEAFAEPSGIQTVTVDALSGKLPTQYTPSSDLRPDIFASFALPTEYDDVHVFVPLGTEPDPTCTNPDPSTCPQITVGGKVETVLHSERPDLPNWEGPVKAWAIANGYFYSNSGVVGDGGSGSNGSGTGTISIGNPPVATITSPADGSTVTQPFSLNATAAPDTGNNIVRIDFLIDGMIVNSVDDTANASYFVTDLSQGTHIFAVHAVDDKQNTDDTSITLKIH